MICCSPYWDRTPVEECRNCNWSDSNWSISTSSSWWSARFSMNSERFGLSILKRGEINRRYLSSSDIITDADIHSADCIVTIVPNMRFIWAGFALYVFLRRIDIVVAVVVVAVVVVMVKHGLVDFQTVQSIRVEAELDTEIETILRFGFREKRK